MTKSRGGSVRRDPLGHLRSSRLSEPIPVQVETKEFAPDGGNTFIARWRSDHGQPLQRRCSHRDITLVSIALMAMPAAKAHCFLIDNPIDTCCVSLSLRSGEEVAMALSQPSNGDWVNTGDTIIKQDTTVGFPNGATLPTMERFDVSKASFAIGASDSSGNVDLGTMNNGLIIC